MPSHTSSPLHNRCNLYIGRALDLKYVQVIAFTDWSRKIKVISLTKVENNTRKNCFLETARF